MFMIYTLGTPLTLGSAETEGTVLNNVFLKIMVYGFHVIQVL